MNDILNKRLYKLTLIILKALPPIMGVAYFLNFLCAYFGNVIVAIFQVLLHYLGLVITPLLFMLISSYVFKFCNYHRMFIYYIAVDELLLITDWYFKLPISNKAICIIHFAISVIFFVIAIGMYIKKRKTINCINNKDYDK